MVRRLLRAARAYIEPRAVVLMYHRVATPATDIWDLAVAPARFEQHLQVLRESFVPLPAAELVAQLRRGPVRRRSCAITFDDGYVDNYLVARPLLQAHQVPATFFIAAGNVDQRREFWWDELEHLLLEAEPLPPSLALPVGGQLVEAALAAEQHLSPLLRRQHQQWKASYAPPPTARAAAFYRLWELLKPLPHELQQQHLGALRAWSGRPDQARPDYLSVTPTQLLGLNREPLFTIGAHTVTHPALASHAPAVQAQELRAGRGTLRQATGAPVGLLAYPYGDHGAETLALAAAAGFDAAFTTEARAVTRRSDPYRLGRFQVGDWDGDEFRRRLTEWFQ